MFWCGAKNRWCSVWSCGRQQCEFEGKEGGQQVYKTVNGEWTNDDYSKSKTVRLYPETLEVIEGYKGKNFSEKLRNLVKDFARQNQENVRQNGGNERG